MRLAEHRASGLSLERFARERGLSIYQLSNWHSRFRAEARAERAGGEKQVMLAEVRVRPEVREAAHEGVDIFVGAGTYVRVYRESNDEAVLRAVRLLRMGATQC
jgi:hypothetical protein